MHQFYVAYYNLEIINAITLGDEITVQRQLFINGFLMSLGVYSSVQYNHL
jgi:hypothetical protein